MTTALQPRGGGGGAGRPSSSSLAEVLDTILDKGLVIDAFVRVSLVGIEILTIDARVVVASVDTYLRFAQAVNRLDIAAEKPGLPDVIKDAASGGKASAAKEAIEEQGQKLMQALEGKGDNKDTIEAVGQKLLGALTSGQEQEQEADKPKRTTSRRKTQS
ncbi:gas vesicle protein GvpJ [Nocardia sp. NPDC050406]|uniref:gas vesicle protein GvpJ n=1 Tax=Nocardia sp. NPDC050406 TaxID=3364318 RepID=UPI0037BB05B1